MNPACLRAMRPAQQHSCSLPSKALWPCQLPALSHQFLLCQPSALHWQQQPAPDHDCRTACHRHPPRPHVHPKLQFTAAWTGLPRPHLRRAQPRMPIGSQHAMRAASDWILSYASPGGKKAGEKVVRPVRLPCLGRMGQDLDCSL